MTQSVGIKNVSKYTIIPLQGRILFRKDDAEKETRGGIVLPDSAKIENLTGRIVEISPDIEHDDDLPIRKYDKVLVFPGNAIPVDFDSENKLFIIPVVDVIAVFKKNKGESEDEGDATTDL